MAGAMRKMAVYLGLVEDGQNYGEYAVDENGYPIDDYDVEEYDQPQAAEPAPAAAGPQGDAMASVSRLPERRPASRTDLSRITTLTPRTYNEARTIGESFRDGVPVIMNLGEMDDTDAKRLVDFAAGLVFGMRGTIERISSKVFLLSPSSITVTAEEKKRLVAGEFYNQS
ncbi:MAG: cell division protein SepF [Jiangellales bacterium]